MHRAHQFFEPVAVNARIVLELHHAFHNPPSGQLLHPGSEPSEEYLRILDELLECRDDDALNNIKARLQDQRDRELCQARTERGFVKR